MNTAAERTRRGVLHVIVPQREGAVGGSDLHVLDLAAAQREHGQWRPVVLAPRGSDDYQGRLRDADVPVVPAPGGRLMDWHRLPGTAGLELVHSHGYEANYLVAGLRLTSRHWASLAAVVTGHGWIETSPWLRLKSALDRWTARSADVRIASAAAHAPRFRSRHQTVVIHNGVRAPDRRLLADLRSRVGVLRRELGIPEGRFVMGVVGRLSPEKRVDLAIETASRVAASHPEVHVLVVGGGGADHHRLEALAERLDLSDRVTFTGLLRDVMPAYTAMDLLVQVSDTEGSPRTVLEAMAFGLPVVATDVGDVSALLDDGAAGLLVPPGDVDALGKAVVRSITQLDESRRRADCALARHRSHFALEVMREQVDQAYEAALRRAAARRL